MTTELNYTVTPCHNNLLSLDLIAFRLTAGRGGNLSLNILRRMEWALLDQFVIKLKNYIIIEQ